MRRSWPRWLTARQAAQKHSGRAAGMRGQVKIEMPFRTADRENLDKILAMIGMLVSALLTVGLTILTRSILHGVLMIFITLACAAYLVVRPRLSGDFPSLPTREASTLRLRLVINILYFLLFSLSVLSIALRSTPYARPVIFFILVGLLGGLLAYESCLVLPGKGYEAFVLAKCILLGLLLRLVPQAIFPGVIWFDSWYHGFVVRDMLATAQIPELGAMTYSRLPVLHLQVASGMLLTGLNYKYTFMYLISTLQVAVVAIFSFALAKRLFSDHTVALLAALIACVADLMVAYGIYAFPNVLAMMYASACIYMILVARRGGSPSIGGLAIFLMAIMILTHTVASLAMAVLLLCLWGGFHVFQRVFSLKRVRSPVNMFTVALFIVAMLFWWMYASGHFFLLVQAVRWAFQVDRFQLPAPEQALAYMTSIPLHEVILDRLGYFIFYGLSAMGSLYMVSKRAKSGGFGFGLALGGVIFASIGFIGSAVQVYFHSVRWYFMSQLFLALPAGVGIVALSSRADRFRPVFTGALVACLTFSMVSNTVANFDTPVISSSRLVRHAFIESELVSMDEILSRWDETVSSDTHTNVYVSAMHDRDAVDFSEALDQGDMLLLGDSLIVVRDTITRDPFYVRGTIWKLDFDLDELLDSQGFMRVFDSGTVRGYLRGSNP